MKTPPKAPTANRTYRHGDAWLTEVPADGLNSHSRPATPEEIAAAEAAEKPARGRKRQDGADDV